MNIYNILKNISIKFNKKDYDISWIWLSELHKHIYFGSQGVLGIYNYSNEKWYEINNDYIADYVEALTTTSIYLCFSGIGENFQVFSLPDFKFVKELNYYAGGWGAAAHQDYLFVTPFEQEQDKDALLLVDIEKEKIIRKYQFPEPPKDDYLLSAISCNYKCARR